MSLDNAKYFGMDMPKQGSDFGTVTCHGSCYILKGDDALMDADELPLIGQHNIVNVLAALLDCGYSGYGVGGFGVVVIINILFFCDPFYAVFQAFKGFDGCYH
jgi:UDP-N-acetylmuramoylalanine-D-glutamate ligase